jgi:C4-dicarboxylate transporter DctM subunit
VAAAQTFGWFLTVVRIPQAITSMVVSNVTSPWVFLGIINAVLLVVGMFMEGIAAIIILAPLFFPIAMKMGIDPLHLGIVMVANLSIGNFTPPFGLNLFVASGVTGLPMSEIIPAVMRFILVSLAGVLIITYIPAISTFLPKLVYP